MTTVVQTYTQHTPTVTMLQTRPASAGGIMSGNQGLPNRSYGGRGHMTSASYGGTPTGYRGSSGPVQPRSFSGQQNLNHNMQWQHYAASRTNSSPAVPSMGTYDPNAMYRAQYGNVYAPQNVAYAPSFGVPTAVRDDSALASRNFAPVQQSTYYGAGGVPPRNGPDRYRRSNGQAVQHNRSQSSINSGYASNNNSGLYKLQSGSLSVPNLSGSVQVASTPENDMHLPVRPGSANKNSAPRRGSFTAHSRNGSSESVSSVRSNNSRPSSVSQQRYPASVQSEQLFETPCTNRDVMQANKHHAPVPTVAPSSSPADEVTSKADQSKVISVPARGSSSDAVKRTLNPSPLSRQTALSGDSVADPASEAMAPSALSNGNLDSPAAKQLAAITQKGGKGKSKTSRLRRAFSFGSAADFRKAAEVESANKAEPAKLHKEPSPDEAYDAEQARIAQAQEAGGIGNSIYGSRFFGSTDNLSISSTASSASVMIRKMGRGMKKSTRSLVGLFRPKSVIGIPAAEPLEPETSQATASMVTVEAETQRVNVTADPLTANGGTGFPHLERNSLDAAQIPEIGIERLGSSGTDRPESSRRNIAGGDRERAEVLAAVRKGILKRKDSQHPALNCQKLIPFIGPGSSSPSTRPSDISPELVLPGIPIVSDSPSSSAPSTPNDEAHGHRRTGSIALSTEDYFSTGLRIRSGSKSTPGTPQGGSKRNATFSPRIVFYDTWPSQEYDRRGEIATCNRLTPLLAQQIKEELNSFKMVSICS